MHILLKEIILAAAERGTASPLDDEEEWDDREERDALDADGLIEPPVPPGLGQLSGSLRAFMDLFEVDQDLVGAAAQTSPPLQDMSEPLERWVPLLPEPERNRFLLRSARGEPITAELLRRLREVGGHTSPAAATAPRRAFSAIVTTAKEVQRQRNVREQQQAERLRLAKLDALAKREEQVWAQIPELLARRTASGYDEAVAHLVELRDLASHRKQRAAFDARLEEVTAPYATSTALQRRLREKRLVG